MLSELFLYLTTSCPGKVRRMGYLYEAIALRARYGRNALSWQPHLENARRSVLTAAQRCRNCERAVILGAGLLLDVPLQELSGLFREVVLVDIVFLPEVRRKVKRYNNVRLVEHDVAGIAERLYQAVREKKARAWQKEGGKVCLPESVPGLPVGAGTAGLVVSLNILSQLAFVPKKYAANHLHDLDNELLNTWCRSMVELHYEWLKTLAGDVCLVSDFRYINKDRKGMIMEQGSTIEGIDLPVPDAVWAWDIAPLGELSRSYSRELVVGAWQVHTEGS